MTAGATDRRQRKFLAVRRQLLDAGRSVIADVGASHATIQMMTDTADVAQATFYSHFESKAEFLEAVRDDTESVLHELIEAPHHSPHIKLAELVSTLVMAAVVDPVSVRCGLQLFEGPQEERAVDRGLLRIVQEGSVNGQFVNVRADDLVASMLSTAVHSAVVWTLMCLDADTLDPSDTEQLTSHVHGVVRNALRLVGTAPDLRADALGAVA